MLVGIIWNKLGKEEAMETEGSEWVPFSVDYGFYSPLMSGSIDGTDTRPHDRGVTRALASECKG